MRLDHLLSKEHLATPRTAWRAGHGGRSRRGRDAPVNPLAIPSVEVSVLASTAPWGWECEAGSKTGGAHCSVLRVRALGRGPPGSGIRPARVRGTDLENSIASASIYDQVGKGLRWMPWRQEPMKDA